MAMAISYTPEFKRNLRRLAKKYRQIRSDLDPLLQQLQASVECVRRVGWHRNAPPSVIPPF